MPLNITSTLKHQHACTMIGSKCESFPDFELLGYDTTTNAQWLSNNDFTGRTAEGGPAATTLETDQIYDAPQVGR